MDILNQTMVTLDCLTEFNARHQRGAKIFLMIMSIILAACSVFLAGFLIYAYAVWGYIPATTDILYAVIFPILSLNYLLLRPLLIKRAIRKSPMLDATVTYRFTEDCMEMSMSSPTSQQTGTLQYSAVTKVIESAHYLYLYTSDNTAHVIAKDGFTRGSADALLLLLRTKVEAKRIKVS